MATAPRFPRPERSAPPPVERRRPALTREAIVDAALAIVDAEGVDAVSMRRVADALGTGPASLYAHVENKDELLELVLDKVIGEVPLFDPASTLPWTELIKQYMRDGRAVFTTHKDIARAAVGRIPMGPNGLRVNDSWVGALRKAGLPPRLVGLAPDLFALYIVAVSVEEGAVATLGLSEERIGAYFDEVRAFFAGLSPQEYPNLSAMASELTDVGGEGRFEFGLDVLVRGLASLAADESAAARAPAKGHHA
jgi:AcrR family transcriptional regulator